MRVDAAGMGHGARGAQLVTDALQNAHAGEGWHVATTAGAGDRGVRGRANDRNRFHSLAIERQQRALVLQQHGACERSARPRFCRSG